jgi:F0F1-type ATP synthase membrane subunit b/b'
MKRLLACAGFLGLLVLLAGTSALAQEGEASPADSAVGYVFRWLNFAIVVGAIIYFAVTKSGPYFRRNADDIAQKIAEGRRAREAAEERRREIEARMAGLDQEIARMRAEAKRDADAEAQRLRAMARAEAEKIERAAQAEIAAAERAGRLELKKLTARFALERAEVLLRQQLNADIDAGLFRVFVEELHGRAN